MWHSPVMLNETMSCWTWFSISCTKEIPGRARNDAGILAGQRCAATFAGSPKAVWQKTKRVSWKTSPDWSPFSRPQERKRRGRWAEAKGGKREKAPEENRLAEAAVSFENPSKSNTKMTIHAFVNNIRIAPAVGPNPYIRFNSTRARGLACSGFLQWRRGLKNSINPIAETFKIGYNIFIAWGYSSVGRAFGSQSKGHRFDSGYLQKKSCCLCSSLKNPFVFAWLLSFRGWCGVGFLRGKNCGEWKNARGFFDGCFQWLFLRFLIDFIRAEGSIPRCSASK